jgi:hypothetical protein
MAFLTALWLPIVLSALALFFASYLAWAVLPIHDDDFQALPDEAAVTGLARNIPAGNYAFPHHQGFKSKRDPEYAKVWMAGPTGTLAVWPKINMGRNMVLTFLTMLVVSIIIAYLTWNTRPPGADFGAVLRVAGTAGILAWSFAFLPNDIWFNRPRRATIANIIEGIVYGLITGLIFALLWPSA